MRNFFTELLRQLQGIWKRLDGGQRLVVVAVLAAAVVGLGAIVWFAGRPSYENVFQSIDAEELRDARRALGQAAVPFITDDSGQGILVDRARIAQANAALSANGLRGNSQSRNNPLLSTMIADSETKASLLDDAARARTQAAIRALDGVTAVTVSSMRLRRSPFSGRDRDTQPRATVALRLKAGVAFESVAKAAASQAASDLGVPMTNVEVVNASSHQRWTYDPDREAGGGAGEFMAQQRSLGDARTTMAQQALDALYPGKTLVTVNIELDPDWMIVSEKVLPVEPLLKTDKTQKDNTENGAGNAGASGDPSATASTEAAAAAPKNSAKKETRDREYVTDYGERRHGKLAPEIKRLSVGLLYDKSLE
ncbi:MAG TPA: hypothetical protein VK348_09750, partial [Planctomycetota bacterium]|nr:hypothetical protein [Planctomycetota bacterium]